MTRCPTSNVSRLRCKSVNVAWVRVDPSVRSTVESLATAPHVRALLANEPMPHRGSSYGLTRSRFVSRLLWANVDVVQGREGQRTVWKLGPAFAPCASPAKGKPLPGWEGYYGATGPVGCYGQSWTPTWRELRDCCAGTAPSSPSQSLP